MYQLLESEGPNIIQRVATTDDASSSEASNYEAANSFLHWIAARSKILPYIDMVKWIIENINIANRTFLTSIKIVIESFIAQDLKKMYYIPNPKRCMTKLSSNILQVRMRWNKIQLNDGNPTQTNTKMKSWVCTLYLLSPLPILISQL